MRASPAPLASVRWALLALAASLVGPACPAPSAACNIDDDCLQNEACILGRCTPVDDSGEGEGEAGEGEGEAGEGEGEGDAGEGEGEGDAGEGEGEGEGENTAPLLEIPPARVRIGESTVLPVLVFDAEGDEVALELVDAGGGDVTPVGPILFYEGVALGDDVFTVRAVDDRGGIGEPVVVTVRVLPADWLDTALTSRARVDIVAQPGVFSATPDVPVLVTFAESGDAQLFDDVADVVVFAAADGTLLPFDPDRQNAGPGFWVLADVDARQGANDFFWAYAGGSTNLVTPPTFDVWRDYVAVYHLTDLTDATGNHGTAVAEGPGASPALCKGSPCYDFAGVDQGVVLGQPFDGVAALSGATVSATIAVRTAPPILGCTVCLSVAGSTGGSRVALEVTSNFQTQVLVKPDDSTTNIVPGGVLVPDDDAVVDAVMDVDDATATMFFAGVPLNPEQLVPASPFPGTPSGVGLLGVDENNPGADFDGRLDEVRIARVARDPEFVLVDAASRAAALAFIGAVER